MSDRMDVSEPESVCAACGEPVSYTDEGGCVGTLPNAYHFRAECLLEALRRTEAERGAVCACSFAGTDVTPEGKCGTCGKPLDQQSVAWLAREYGRLRRQLEGAVGDE